MGEYYAQGGYEGTYDSSYGAGDQTGYAGASWEAPDYSQGYESQTYDQGYGKSEGGYNSGRSRGRGRGGYSSGGGGGYQSGGYQQQSGYGGGRGGGYRGARGGGGYGGYSQGQTGGNYSRGRGRGGFQSKGEFRTLDDTVYITGLSDATANEDLVDGFGVCGEIKKNATSGASCVFLFLDRVNQTPTGAGSVAFVNKESATQAIEQFDGKDFNGSTIKVEYQKKRVKDYGEGGGFRGGRGGGRGGGYQQGGYGGYQQGGYGGYQQGGGGYGGRGGYSNYSGGYEASY